MFLKVAGAILFVVVFNAAVVGIMLMLPPWWGLAWGLTLGAIFLWWHLRADARAPGRRALIRIRAPRVPAGLLGLATAATLIGMFGVAGLIGLVSRPIEREEMRGWQLLVEYQKTVPGWIALTAVIALVIPVAEEFNFRGRVQHALEARYGVAVAIAATSLLFAVTHIGVPRSAILLIPLTLGIANGVSVYLFDSIWGAVITHALWNATMAAMGAVTPDSAPDYGGMNRPAVLGTSIVLIALGAAGWYLTVQGSKRVRLRGAPHVNDTDPAREGNDT